MRKIGLFGFVAVGLLVAGLFSNVFNVSAKQWTGLNIPYGVAIGDFDMDTNVDLAYVEAGAAMISVYSGVHPHPLILPPFPPSGTPPPPLVSPYDLAMGDFDGNGWNDIAFSDPASGSVYVYSGIPPYLQLAAWGGLALPSGIAIGDYDLDGRNEVAVAEMAAGTVRFYDFAVGLENIWSGFAQPTGVAIGDYDPGFPGSEVAVADIVPGIVLVFNLLTFPTPTGPPWVGLMSPQGVSIGDFDNNPVNGNEIAFAEFQGSIPDGTIKVFYSGYSSIPMKIFQVPRGTSGVAIGGDFGNCGWNDLAFSDVNSRVTVYRWGDLGSLVGGIPTYFVYDDKVDGIDLALFVQCYKKLAPANAMYLADLGRGTPAPTFFTYDNKVDGMDLALFVQCYHGFGPGDP